MSESNPLLNEPGSGAQAAALNAARLGETLVAAVRAARLEATRNLLLPGSPAALALELFGLAFFRLLLRLDDPREGGRLAPYDIQIEPEVALLELGVVTRPGQPAAAGEQSHLLRLFGSSVVLRPAPAAEFEWLVEEIWPVNAGNHLNPEDPTDRQILALYQGAAGLAPRLDSLDQVEGLFVPQMQSSRPGRFNLEELFNAVRLWRDFRSGSSGVNTADTPGWAAAIEYLVTVFDYHQADAPAIAAGYDTTPEALTDCAREIAASLRVTQFDDRYSVHADAVAHYRAVFGELGIDPRRDEAVRRSAAGKVFDSVEVPPDDDTFFGPS